MNTSKYSVVGHPTPKMEAPDKVRGRYNYLADECHAGMLIAVPILSTCAHAKIKKIDAAEALKLEGVIRVFTGEDVPQIKYNSGEWFPGQRDHPDELMLTCHARHVGDRIGLMVATSEALARRAI